MGKRIRSLERQIGKKVYKFPKALKFEFYRSNFVKRLQRLKSETEQLRRFQVTAKLQRAVQNQRNLVEARKRRLQLF